MRSKIKLTLTIALGAMLALSSCQNAGNEESESRATEKIVLNNLEEAREFVRNNLEEPIPDTYQIPGYISSGLPIEQVYDSLEVRFPDFYGLDGDVYLNAIIKSPERYLQLSLESKSIRRYYDPNSKY